MKILRNIGIVVGVHAVALIVFLANPGCSSTSPSAAHPAPADTAAAKPPAPIAAIAVPNVTSPAADPPGDAMNPVSPDSASAPTPGPIFFSPTRPGTPAAAAVEAQPVADVTPVTTYVVAKGDSLWYIAKKNHLKVHDIAMANNLRPGTNLYPGQKIIIPGQALTGTAEAVPAQESAAPTAPVATHRSAPAESVKYVVKPGETLGGIAHRYNVRMGDIATANSISDPKKIHPGQVLIIPGAHMGAKGARPAKTPAGAASAKPSEATKGAAAPAASPPVPPPGSDLDSGLKPADSAAPPVIKVEEAPPPPKP